MNKKIIIAFMAIAFLLGDNSYASKQKGPESRLEEMEPNNFAENSGKGGEFSSERGLVQNKDFEPPMSKHKKKGKDKKGDKKGKRGWKKYNQGSKGKKDENRNRGEKKKDKGNPKYDQNNEQRKISAD